MVHFSLIEMQFLHPPEPDVRLLHFQQVDDSHHANKAYLFEIFHHEFAFPF